MLALLAGPLGLVGGLGHVLSLRARPRVCATAAGGVVVAVVLATLLLLYGVAAIHFSHCPLFDFGWND